VFELQRRGYAARGWVLPGSSASILHGRWPSCGVAEKARIGRDLFRSEDDRPAAKPATPLLSLRWTFRAKRAVITDAIGRELLELQVGSHLPEGNPARIAGAGRAKLKVARFSAARHQVLW